MKTELEYANELVEKYDGLARSNYDEIQCAIIDVENTIDALVKTNIPTDTCLEVCEYYERILQILKDKL